MPLMKSLKKTSNVLGIFAVALVFHCAAAAPERVRQPQEDINSREVREKQGLRPSKAMLFNGWGLTPAGEQIPISDLALKLAFTPDKKKLVAVHGGFNKHGVTLIDLATRKETQFLPLAETWNGLAFSRDGKQFYVSGGDSGQIHIFNYAKGETTFERSVKPSAEGAEVFLAGIAIQPSSGKVYVCNEANHEVWVLDPDSLALEARIPVGQHPHTCVLGADRRHLYVSNW